MLRHMRFLVVGAGAVGGVIAGRLLQAGYDVTVVARGTHAAVMQDKGLRLESPSETVTLALPVVVDPAAHEWSPDDVVVLAVKSQDTVAVLTGLAAVAPPSVLVVCAQNGVANETTALRWFEQVAGMCVMCPTSHLEPGVVQAHATPLTGLLDVGDYPHGAGSRVTELAAALSTATFDSVPRPDVMRWKHAKLLMNLGNAVEAVCGPQARTGRLVQLLRDEGRTCFETAGIPYASQAEDEARRAGRLRVQPIADRPRGGGSSWQSLQRGTGAIETDYLNGEVVRLGRLHGVPTPANALMQRVANQHARDGRPPGTLTEDELLGQLPWCGPSAGAVRRRGSPRSRGRTGPGWR